MQKSGFPKMCHYVGFWQIASYIVVCMCLARDCTCVILKYYGVLPTQSILMNQKILWKCYIIQAEDICMGAYSTYIMYSMSQKW